MASRYFRQKSLYGLRGSKEFWRGNHVGGDFVDRSASKPATRAISDLTVTKMDTEATRSTGRDFAGCSAITNEQGAGRA